VVPEDAELTRRHDEIPSWQEIPDELKPVLARQMELYAGSSSRPTMKWSVIDAHW